MDLTLVGFGGRGWKGRVLLGGRGGGGRGGCEEKSIWPKKLGNRVDGSVFVVGGERVRIGTEMIGLI